MKARTDSKLVSRARPCTRLTECVENIPKLFAVTCTSCNFVLPIGTVFLFVKRPQLTALYHPLTSVSLKPCAFKPLLSSPHSSSRGATFRIKPWRHRLDVMSDRHRRTTRVCMLHFTRQYKDTLRRRLMILIYCSKLYTNNYSNIQRFDEINAKIKWCSFFASQCRNRKQLGRKWSGKEVSFEAVPRNSQRWSWGESSPLGKGWPFFSCRLLTTPIFPRRLSSVLSKFSHKKFIFYSDVISEWCHPGRSAAPPHPSSDATGVQALFYLTVKQSAVLAACVLRATTKKGRHLFWGKKCTQRKSCLRPWLRATWLEDFLTSKWPGSFTVLHGAATERFESATRWM